MDYIFCAEQIEVPKDLPSIMKNWTKEVIRYGPADIVSFSRRYFEVLVCFSCVGYCLLCTILLGFFCCVTLCHLSRTNVRCLQSLANGPEAHSDFLAEYESQANPRRQVDKTEDEKAQEATGYGIPAGAASPEFQTILPEDPNRPRGRNPDELEAGEGITIPKSPGQTSRGRLEKNSPRGPKLPDAPGGQSQDATKRAIYKKAFDVFDVNGDGHIETTELERLLVHLKWDHGEAAVERARKTLDADNNGTIDLEEFLNWTSYAWKFQAHGGNRKISLSVASSSAGPVDRRRNSFLDNIGEAEDLVEEEEEEDEEDE